eukprot:4379732-Pyramimonas_sp.AAC.1
MPCRTHFGTVLPPHCFEDFRESAMVQPMKLVFGAPIDDAAPPSGDCVPPRPRRRKSNGAGSAGGRS